MLKNYIKIALRDMHKNKIYSIINILGLAIGVACCIAVTAIIQDELNYDKFHEDADSIYRLVFQRDDKDEFIQDTLFDFEIVPHMPEELAFIEQATAYTSNNVQITYQNEWYPSKIAQVHNSFLNMFSFPLEAGNPETALSEPNKIAISRELATRIFGDLPNSEIMGKTVQIYNKSEFIISAILEDVPKNSSMEFEALIQITSPYRYGVNSNFAGSTTIYVKTTEGYEDAKMEDALKPFMKKFYIDKYEDNEYLTGLGSFDGVVSFGLQPLKDIHLEGEVKSYYILQGSPTTLKIVFVIAVLVLLIGCFNFVTLSLGRSTGRSQEVGIRKVLGAHRLQVMQQFFGETLVLVVLAFAVALGIAEFLLQGFNSFWNTSYSISFLSGWQMPLAFLGILLVTALIAGFYPALLFARFPAVILRSHGVIASGGWVTKSLIVLQYSMAIVLMIMTVIIGRQLTFMQNKSLGYNQEQVVIVDVPNEEFSEKYKTQLAQYPQILSAGGSDRTFTSGSQTRSMQNDLGEWIYARFIRVDPDYLKTLDIELLEGRNFSSERTVDAYESLIVNEAMVEALKTENPLGMQLDKYKSENAKQAPRIIGVVKNFHIDNLHREIKPLVLHMNPDFHGIYALFARVAPGNIRESLNLLEESWQAISPDWPFNYSFLDENLAKQYQEEEKWRTLVSYASAFSVGIASMGLLGLALLAAARRTVEIGVRKVLGASITNIVRLLSTDFVKLLLVANTIAWPVAYLVVDQWLQNFAFRIGIAWWVFALAGAAALMIALVTTSSQAVRAAMANPVKSLRYE